MKPKPVIAVFDIGKTNKKLFLFNEQYQSEFERTTRFSETMDEDGDPCEHLESLRLFILDSLRDVTAMEQFEVKAVNFTAYGASFVYIDTDGEPLTPLYNYLKPYPSTLQQELYSTHNGEALFALETASPALGSLNSGLQLLRLKKEKPSFFSKMQYALHLPQYLAYLVTGKAFSDLTSIGCHTALWDFNKQQYHQWTVDEHIRQKLAPIASHQEVYPVKDPISNKLIRSGIGLHDSSSALIPYLLTFPGPFVLISTGTWSISLHPFNNTPLTEEELQQDCLCYLSWEGHPVKASRLFSGQFHEEQVKRIAAHFGQQASRYNNIQPDKDIIRLLLNVILPKQTTESDLSPPSLQFHNREVKDFEDDITAYHQLMVDIVSAQVRSTALLLKDKPVKTIYVDGGFSRNELFMHLLSIHFPHISIYAASMAQATAIGAALAIHRYWNTGPLPENLIALQHIHPG
ncbi:MAG: FGGY-family carbohydrate kinase [Pseudobacter sp.]|uniref:FGGY-family carbohydrate kinase n=1 Tax=Pseudobacter sp. TaxID=2045420 RepID=UPI003F8036CD